MLWGLARSGNHLSNVKHFMTGGYHCCLHSEHIFGLSLVLFFYPRVFIPLPFPYCFSRNRYWWPSRVSWNRLTVLVNSILYLLLFSCWSKTIAFCVNFLKGKKKNAMLIFEYPIPTRLPIHRKYLLISAEWMKYASKIDTRPGWTVCHPGFSPLYRAALKAQL